MLDMFASIGERITGMAKAMFMSDVNEKLRLCEIMKFTNETIWMILQPTKHSSLTLNQANSKKWRIYVFLFKAAVHCSPIPMLI